MTLGEIYIYINAMIAKEVEGRTFSPATFNPVLQTVNLEVFKDEFSLLEQQAKAQGVQLYQLLFSGSPLRDFTETHSSSGSSTILLSSITPSFEYFIACTAIHNNIYKDVELVDIAEANYRRAKVDGMNLYEQPIITLYKDRLRVLPTDITGGLELIYLRLPETPFYDYFIDNTTGKYYYFQPGYHADYVSEGKYEISDNNNIPLLQFNDVICPNNTTYAHVYYSASTELEWKESYHPDIIKRILVKAGVPIRDEFIIQAAKA